MHPYLEAASNKHNLKLQATSYKHQAPSEDKKSPQASSDKQQESCDLNPSLTSDKILVPGNSLQEA
jgi:hypothetical protein|tara:strand:- start:103 stop:300 length:198 start_codon:yes stop_codon:yes gene_type:complete